MFFFRFHFVKCLCSIYYIFTFFVYLCCYYFIYLFIYLFIYSLTVLTITMDICKICNKEIDVGQNTVTLTDRGSAGVNNASIEREGEAFSLPGDEVHVDCRRSFTDKKRIQVAKRRVQTETPDEPGPSLRSISTFDFRVLWHFYIFVFLYGSYYVVISIIIIAY